MKTIELEKEFEGAGEVKGMHFKLDTRNQYVSIYEVNDGGVIHYEVFLRKFTPVCIDFSKRIYSDDKMREVYPKSKDFGIRSWTYRKYPSAKIKFIELTKKMQENERK